MQPTQIFEEDNGPNELQRNDGQTSKKKVCPLSAVMGSKNLLFAEVSD